MREVCNSIHYGVKTKQNIFSLSCVVNCKKKKNKPHLPLLSSPLPSPVSQEFIAYGDAVEDIDDFGLLDLRVKAWVTTKVHKKERTSRASTAAALVVVLHEEDEEEH